MWIASVKLENVRKHEAFESCFEPGVVLLLGANGAGKSSVLMAINYALGGDLPVKAADFVRFGASAAKVTVSFVAGERYTVTRSTSGQYQLSKDGDVLTNGKADTEAKLKSLFGLRPDVSLSGLYEDALNVPQGRLTEGFDLSDKARFEHWSRLLRLDEYRRAWEALRPAVRLLEDRRLRAETEVEALESRFCQLVDEPPADLAAVLLRVEAEVSGLRDEKRRLSAQCDELREAVKAAAVARSVRQANEAQLKKVREKLSSVRSALEGKAVSLAVELEELRRELAGLKPDPSLSEKVERSSKRLADRESEVRRLTAEVARVEKQCQLERDRLDLAQRAQIEVERLTRQLLEGRVSLSDVVQSQAVLESEVERAVLGQKEVRVGELCPVCGEKLTESKVASLQEDFARVIEQGGSELARLAKEKARLKEQIARWQKELEKAQFDVAQGSQEVVDALAWDLQSVRRVLDFKGAELKVAQREYEADREAAAAQRGVFDRHAELKERIARLEAQESARLSDVQRLEGELVSLRDEETDLTIALAVPVPESKEDELEATVVALANLDEMLYSKRQELADWQAVEKLTIKLSESRAAVVFAGDLSSKLKRHRGVMDDVGPLLAERVMSSLSALAGDYWQSMGKDGSLSWDSSFALSLDGKAFGMLSGGEQVVSALACRLAVAHWMANLDWLVLDEPTVHLDEPTRYGLAEAIGQVGLEQVIVVTHDDTFASVADQVVRL